MSVNVGKTNFNENGSTHGGLSSDFSLPSFSVITWNDLVPGGQHQQSSSSQEQQIEPSQQALVQRGPLHVRHHNLPGGIPSPGTVQETVKEANKIKMGKNQQQKFPKSPKRRSVKKSDKTVKDQRTKGKERNDDGRKKKSKKVNEAEKKKGTSPKRSSSRERRPSTPEPDDGAVPISAAVSPPSSPIPTSPAEPLSPPESINSSEESFTFEINLNQESDADLVSPLSCKESVIALMLARERDRLLNNPLLRGLPLVTETGDDVEQLRQEQQREQQQQEMTDGDESIVSQESKRRSRSSEKRKKRRRKSRPEQNETSEAENNVVVRERSKSRGRKKVGDEKRKSSTKRQTSRSASKGKRKQRRSELTEDVEQPESQRTMQSKSRRRSKSKTRSKSQTRSKSLTKKKKRKKKKEVERPENNDSPTNIGLDAGEAPEEDFFTHDPEKEETVNDKPKTEPVSPRTPARSCSTRKKKSNWDILRRDMETHLSTPMREILGEIKTPQPAKARGGESGPSAAPVSKQRRGPWKEVADEDKNMSSDNTPEPHDYQVMKPRSASFVYQAVTTPKRGRKPTLGSRPRSMLSVFDDVRRKPSTADESPKPSATEPKKGLVRRISEEMSPRRRLSKWDILRGSISFRQPLKRNASIFLDDKNDENTRTSHTEDDTEETSSSSEQRRSNLSGSFSMRDRRSIPDLSATDVESNKKKASLWSKLRIGSDFIRTAKKLVDDQKDDKHSHRDDRESPEDDRESPEDDRECPKNGSEKPVSTAIVSTKPEKASSTQLDAIKQTATASISRPDQDNDHEIPDHEASNIISRENSMAGEDSDEQTETHDMHSLQTELITNQDRHKVKDRSSSIDSLSQDLDVLRKQVGMILETKKIQRHLSKWGVLRAVFHFIIETKRRAKESRESTDFFQLTQSERNLFSDDQNEALEAPFRNSSPNLQDLNQLITDTKKKAENIRERRRSSLNDVPITSDNPLLTPTRQKIISIQPKMTPVVLSPPPFAMESSTGYIPPRPLKPPLLLMNEEVHRRSSLGDSKSMFETEFEASAEDILKSERRSSWTSFSTRSAFNSPRKTNSKDIEFGDVGITAFELRSNESHSIFGASMSNESYYSATPLSPTPQWEGVRKANELIKEKRQRRLDSLTRQKFLEESSKGVSRAALSNEIRRSSTASCPGVMISTSLPTGQDLGNETVETTSFEMEDAAAAAAVVNTSCVRRGRSDTALDFLGTIKESGDEKQEQLLLDDVGKIERIAPKKSVSFRGDINVGEEEDEGPSADEQEKSNGDGDTYQDSTTATNSTTTTTSSSLKVRKSKKKKRKKKDSSDRKKSMKDKKKKKSSGSGERKMTRISLSVPIEYSNANLQPKVVLGEDGVTRIVFEVETLPPDG